MKGAVLVVDDSLTVRMDLLDAFHGADMRAVGAASLTEARAILAKRDVAVVVLDLVLPDGAGTDLVSEIRADSEMAQLPILMLSSEADVHDRIRGLAVGANDYAGKPYERDYVLARARELAEQHERATAGKTRSVMVIDDSVTFREALRHALQQRGYRVFIAGSGEEGLRNIAIYRPSAVVVDTHLPGMDGPTVVRRLRLDAALRGTPCLLLTGSTADRSAELNALDAGADSFARKDDDMEMILARIAAVLRSATNEESAPAMSSLMSPKRILAVDDSVTYLDAVGEWLRSEGYDVIQARSGEDALEMLSVQPVDCILVDRLMPGMDGVETCKRIKGSPVTRDIPLIMVTASDDRSALVEALQAGADDCVLKEGGDAVLKARLGAQLRRKQIDDEARTIRVRLLTKELEATEARAARDLAEARAAYADELEQKNRDLQASNEALESFAYTVSHDLRAPIRAMDGFSQALIEDYANVLDEQGRDFLLRIQSSAKHMNTLIDDIMSLARIAAHEFHTVRADIGEVAARVFGRLAEREPERVVEFAVTREAHADCDPGLVEIALDNLIGNAWKFTGKCERPRIEFGVDHSGPAPVYFVRDNGAGFDMAHARKLFGVFQRLHSRQEFDGTGIGLATVQRIVKRHGGRVWAEAAVGQGATFYFTLSPET